MNRALTLFILIAQAALAADPTLLRLVMPGAKAIAGLQVDQAKQTPFGRYILNQMQPDDPGFLKFVADTHFDPRRDLTELVIASAAEADITSHWLVLARGAFNPSIIKQSAIAGGGVATPFQGFELLGAPANTHNPGDSVIAFLDTTTAAMGDPDSVKAAIVRYRASTTPAPAILEKARTLGAKYDFWFSTLAPLSEFALIVPGANLGQAMKSNLFQSVNQATGGFKFGVNVTFGLEAVTKTDKDAAALADVVRFVGDMIQSDPAGKNAAATLADSMTLTNSGNVMNLQFTVPEAQIEKMFNAPRSTKAAPKKL